MSEHKERLQFLTMDEIRPHQLIEIDLGDQLELGKVGLDIQQIFPHLDTQGTYLGAYLGDLLSITERSFPL